VYVELHSDKNKNKKKQQLIMRTAIMLWHVTRQWTNIMETTENKIVSLYQTCLKPGVTNLFETASYFLCTD